METKFAYLCINVINFTFSGDTIRVIAKGKFKKSAV
jgi:hypothetical protein